MNNIRKLKDNFGEEFQCAENLKSEFETLEQKMQNFSENRIILENNLRENETVLNELDGVLIRKLERIDETEKSISEAIAVTEKLN